MCLNDGGQSYRVLGRKSKAIDMRLAILLFLLGFMKNLRRSSTYSTMIYSSVTGTLASSAYSMNLKRRAKMEELL
mgnify:CR=1 FL=1